MGACIATSQHYDTRARPRAQSPLTSCRVVTPRRRFCTPYEAAVRRAPDLIASKPIIAALSDGLSCCACAADKVAAAINQPRTQTISIAQVPVRQQHWLRLISHNTRSEFRRKPVGDRDAECDRSVLCQTSSVECAKSPLTSCRVVGASQAILHNPTKLCDHVPVARSASGIAATPTDSSSGDRSSGWPCRAQRMISKRPSKCSTTAVQLSTQSPQLM